jgi:hypothetical protein
MAVSALILIEDFVVTFSQLFVFAPLLNELLYSVFDGGNAVHCWSCESFPTCVLNTVVQILNNAAGFCLKVKAGLKFPDYHIFL